MVGYFYVSVMIILRTLRWTTASLKCVYGFACMYTEYKEETLVYSLIRKTFVESAQNLTREKSQGRHKA